jgi:hypothetical protein
MVKIPNSFLENEKAKEKNPRYIPKPNVYFCAFFQMGYLSVV